MLLSVLVLTVPERPDPPVIRHLCEQATALPVEILWLGDNRRRSIGAKRQAMLDFARGDYVSFIDDDDDVAADFVESILEAAASEPSVITFDAEIRRDGKPICLVRHRAGWENEAYSPDKTEIRRAAWHTHAWRQSIALSRAFSDSSWSEDWEWAGALQDEGMANAVHIDKVLHFYTYRG